MKNNSSKYISCMKLNGFPILPPVMTAEYRNELLHYKQLAIGVEKRLNEADKVETTTSVEQSLVFNKSRETFKDEIGNRVPYSNLVCDIQVSQYTNNEFQVVYSDQRSLISDCDIDDSIRNSYQEQFDAEGLIGRNIRRSSYTLDNPSPFLIDKLANIDISTSISNDKDSVSNKQRSFTNNDEMKQSDLNETNGNLTSSSVVIEKLVPIEISETRTEEDCQLIKDVSVIDANTIETTKSDITNLCSDTETELMNLSLHSSIESCIDPGNNSCRDLAPPAGTNAAPPDHELYRILADVPKDYSDKLLRLLRDEGAATERRQRAARVIVAWARGHLVRRLLRSAHVQRLVDTIRATLVCAVQLHGETEDRIQAADVELHRRLIQQVSAACCDFHDVFFRLSAADRMRIIRADRQRPRTAHGRLMALASRRKQPAAGTRLFPPLSTVIQTN